SPRATSSARASWTSRPSSSLEPAACRIARFEIKTGGRAARRLRAALARRARRRVAHTTKALPRSDRDRRTRATATATRVGSSGGNTDISSAGGLCMLRFDVMSSGVILSRESFRATLIELEKGEWKPLALSWERLACDLSGIHFDQMKRRFRILQDTDVRGRIRVRRRPDYEGEVFFSGGDLYFCVNPPTDPADRLNRIRQEFVSELWGLDLYNPGQRSMIERASEITLLVGIVTSSGDVTARLKTFSDDFESAASRIATVQPSDVSTNNFPESPEFSWAL